MCPILTRNHFFLSSGAEVAELCKPLAQLNISHFTYTRSYPDGSRIYLSKNPAVIDYYLAEKCYLKANTEFYPQNKRFLTALWSTVPNQQIMQIMSQKFNYSPNGIFIMKPHKDYSETFGFSSPVNNHTLPNTFFTYFDYVKNFTQSFVEQARHLIKCAEKTKVILPFIEDKLSADIPVLADAMFSPKKIPSSALLELNKYKLSNRERECLLQLLQGKSAREIAEAYKLSVRTIEFYFANIKTKLRVKNKAELIIKLLNA